MNILYLFFISIISLILSATSARSVTILLDPFSSGSLALQATGPISNFYNLTGTEFEIRDVHGNGNYGWSAYVDPQSGLFNYTINLRATPAPGDFFYMRYAKQMGALQLMGADSLVFNITALTGQGDLQVTFGGEPGPLTPALPITGLGDAAFPFSALFPQGWSELIGGVTLKIVPKSANFSITLSEISLVPEPSSIVLLGGVAWMWCLRRQRGVSAIL